MALWRIVVKNSGNAACKNKKQRLEKGMFIETSTVSPYRLSVLVANCHCWCSSS